MEKDGKQCGQGQAWLIRKHGIKARHSTRHAAGASKNTNLNNQRHTYTHTHLTLDRERQREAERGLERSLHVVGVAHSGFVPAHVDIVSCARPRSDHMGSCVFAAGVELAVLVPAVETGGTHGRRSECQQVDVLRNLSGSEGGRGGRGATAPYGTQDTHRWAEKYKTFGSSSNMCWIPFPWCTSQSTMRTRVPAPPSLFALAAATATLLKMQKPMLEHGSAW